MSSPTRRPMKRLIEDTVFSGSRARVRWAGAPTSGGPDGGKYTTEGVRRSPSAFARRMGKPASMTPMRELVVPRSMPTIMGVSFWRTGVGIYEGCNLHENEKFRDEMG